MIHWGCKSWAAARAGLVAHSAGHPGSTLAPPSALGMVRLAMVEPGIVTLAKIVGTLLLAMSIVPFLFLLAPGDRSEPETKDTFDGDVQ